jgi:hypothetical protein
VWTVFEEWRVENGEWGGESTGEFKQDRMALARCIA